MNRYKKYSSLKELEDNFELIKDEKLKSTILAIKNKDKTLIKDELIGLDGWSRNTFELSTLGHFKLEESEKSIFEIYNYSPEDVVNFVKGETIWEKPFLMRFAILFLVEKDEFHKAAMVYLEGIDPNKKPAKFIFPQNINWPHNPWSKGVLKIDTSSIMGEKVDNLNVMVASLNKRYDKFKYPALLTSRTLSSIVREFFQRYKQHEQSKFRYGNTGFYNRDEYFNEAVYKEMLKAFPKEYKTVFNSMDNLDSYTSYKVSAKDKLRIFKDTKNFWPDYYSFKRVLRDVVKNEGKAVACKEFASFFNNQFKSGRMSTRLEQILSDIKFVLEENDIPLADFTNLISDKLQGLVLVNLFEN